MRRIETDYLVVGAGASGMSFTDTMLEQSDARIVLVDRRHRPGGHWVDSYPFVRLHQPAAFYGVASRELMADHMRTDGDRWGLATGTEVCEYYLRVLHDHFLPSGRVDWFPQAHWRQIDDDTHELTSLLSGQTTIVRATRRVVDATAPSLAIPARHRPSFEVDDGVTVVPPNGLVEIAQTPSGYTVLGDGKTSMDTCFWLLEQGVPAEHIRWVRNRDSWAMNRENFDPDLAPAGIIDFQARQMEACAEASDARDLMIRFEKTGSHHRLDPDVEPELFRGAILGEGEAATLREIENVVRLGRARSIAEDQLVLDEGTISSDPGQVYVDCTASGVDAVERGPIFSPNRIDLQMTTPGIIPWSAATTAWVEVNRADDLVRNELCPPMNGLLGTGEIENQPIYQLRAAEVNARRANEPDLTAWENSLRLCLMNGVMDALDEPDVQAAIDRLLTVTGAAMENLARLVASSGRDLREYSVRPEN